MEWSQDTKVLLDFSVCWCQNSCSSLSCRGTESPTKIEVTGCPAHLIFCFFKLVTEPELIFSFIQHFEYFTLFVPLQETPGSLYKSYTEDTLLLPRVGGKCITVLPFCSVFRCDLEINSKSHWHIPHWSTKSREAGWEQGYQPQSSKQVASTLPGNGLCIPPLGSPWHLCPFLHQLPRKDLPNLVTSTTHPFCILRVWITELIST